MNRSGQILIISGPSDTGIYVYRGDMGPYDLLGQIRQGLRATRDFWSVTGRVAGHLVNAMAEGLEMEEDTVFTVTTSLQRGAHSPLAVVDLGARKVELGPPISSDFQSVKFTDFIEYDWQPS